MTTETFLPETQAFALPEVVSSVVVQMIDQVRPGVVQVRSGRRGGGAGVIWRANGGILTNYHVVAGDRTPVQVILADGHALDAKVVNSNPSLDLALLEVAASDLPAAPVGDSSRLRVGELVFAIGHPWGQVGVVTAGIVSGVGAVPVRGSNQTAQYIRSDVRLAPGNSGGPLINAQGAVVGINAMIFGGDLAVAIPSHVASAWIAGPPDRPVYLGVKVQPVELPAMARQDAWAEQVVGMLVIDVTAGGPAERATVMIGDVLLGVDDQPATDANTLLSALARRNGSGYVRLNVLRGGVMQTINAELKAPEQPV